MQKSQRKTFVIAEAGVNHNGSKEIALDLIDIAAEAKADAVKFQTFKAEKLASASALTANYQSKNTGEQKQLAMLKALEMKDEDYVDLIAHCKKRNIEFMSTAFDNDSANFLYQLGIKRIKVPSGELTNKQLIQHLAKQNLPTIISTGMANLEEISEAICWFQEARNAIGNTADISHDLTILHCTSNYPAPLTELNLNAIKTIAKEFGLPVGYSDHSAGIVAAPLAVAAGASVIEKHFTLSKKMEGPDHLASLEPKALIEMIENIRQTEQVMGSYSKAPAESELPVRGIVRKSITVASDMKAGQCITPSDLVLLRPGTGIPPKEMENVVGRKLIRDVKPGEMPTWADFE